MYLFYIYGDHFISVIINVRGRSYYQYPLLFIKKIILLLLEPNTTLHIRIMNEFSSNALLC